MTLIRCNSCSAAVSGAGEEQEDMCRRYPWKHTSSCKQGDTTGYYVIGSIRRYTHILQRQVTNLHCAKHFISDVTATKLFLQSGTRCCVHHLLPHLGDDTTYTLDFCCFVYIFQWV